MKTGSVRLKVVGAHAFLAGTLMLRPGALKAADLPVLYQTLAETGQSGLAAPAEIPFKLYRDYAIVVRGSVGDCDKLNLFIDTGASSTVVDLALARKLRLPVSPRTIQVFSNAVASGDVVLPSLQLGPVRVVPMAAVVQDLSGLSDSLLVRVDVIIGIDVLARSSFALDYKTKKLILGPVGTFANSVQCDARAPYPTVPLEVGGRVLRVYVDTGAQELALFESPSAPIPHKRDGEGRTGIGGQVVVEPAEFQALRLGATHWAKRKGLVMQAPYKLFDGLLGPKWLGASRIAFDVEHRIVSWDN